MKISFKTLQKLTLLIVSIGFTPQSIAHVSYFDITTLANPIVLGGNSQSWLDGTDTHPNDTTPGVNSHTFYWFQLSIATTSNFSYTLTGEQGTNPDGSNFSALVPGVSIYSGLVPSGAHEGENPTCPTCNAVYSLDDITMWNAAGDTATINYLAHAVGAINNKTATLSLPTLAAGDYTILIGGADPGGFDGVATGYNGGFTIEYTLTAVPVPSAFPLMLTALGTLGFKMRKKTQS